MSACAVCGQPGGSYGDADALYRHLTSDGETLLVHLDCAHDGLDLVE